MSENEEPSDIEKAATEDPPRVAKKAAKKATKKKAPEQVLEEHETRLQALERAAQTAPTGVCHMCHKPGAPRSGNSKRFLHVPGCASRYKAGESPDPVND